MPSDIVKTIYYSSTIQRTKQQWHTSHGSKSSKQSPTNNKFQGRKNPSAPLYIETKILNLTNIITLNNCRLVLDHLNIGLPAIFDNLFKPFKEQHSENTRGARRCVLNIPKMKTLFYGSRSVQVKSIKDWNNIIDKIHYTAKDFMKRFEVIKKMKNTLLW